MAKINISPFLTLPDSSAAIKVTETKANGTAMPRNAFIDGYTADTELRIRVNIDLDAPHIYEQLGISRRSLLVFVTTVRSPKTYFNSCHSSDTIEGSFSGTKSFEILIPAGMVADTLTLEHSLVLHSANEKGEALSVEEPSSIVWQTNAKFLLEGTGSMFPITLTEFNDFEGGKYAAWRVDWSKVSLFGAPSRVRLLINSKNHGFVRRVSPEGDGLADPGSLEMLHLGVAESILRFAAKNGRELAANEFPEGSLGSYIRRFLQTYMRQDGNPPNIDNALSIFSESPETALAILQSNLALPTLRGE